MVRVVKKRMGARRPTRCAIEFFERGARVAVLTRRKGRFVVSDLIEVDFPEPASGESIPRSVKAAALREALRSHGWRPGPTVLVLPKNIVTMRLVKLPSTDDAELAEMARFEAQKYIPFNVERHVITHAVVRKEGVEGSSALLAAVDRAALDEPLAVCHEAAVELVSARVSALAMVEALMFDPPERHDERTFALVNIGWSTVDITVVSEGIVRLARSGTMGVMRIAPVLKQALPEGQNLSRERLEELDALSPEDFFGHKRKRPRRKAPAYVVDDFAEETVEQTHPVGERSAGSAEADLPGDLATAEGNGPAGDVARWLERLVQEIRRTYSFATREFELPELETVYLGGVGSYISNVDTYLQRAVGCRVVRMQAPASLEFSEAGGRDLRQAWREFAVTVGAAIGAAVPQVDLLPPEYVEQLRTRKRRRSMALTGSLMFLLICLGVGYTARWMSDQRRLLEFYNSQNEKLAPQVRELRDKERRIRIVRRIVEDPLSAGALLEKVSAISLVMAPKPSITLREYDYQKGEGVKLAGYALGYKELDQFVAELEKTGCFKMIKRVSQTPTKLPRRDREVVQFELHCLFTQNTGG